MGGCGAAVGPCGTHAGLQVEPLGPRVGPIPLPQRDLHLPQEEVPTQRVVVPHGQIQRPTPQLRLPHVVLRGGGGGDELKVAEYADARDFYEAAEEFSIFQAWVRSEYAKYGYVEVDDGYLAHREQVRACSDTAREAALEAMDFSDGDEDLKMFFRKRRH